MGHDEYSQGNKNRRIFMGKKERKKETKREKKRRKRRKYVKKRKEKHKRNDSNDENDVKKNDNSIMQWLWCLLMAVDVGVRGSGNSGFDLCIVVHPPPR